jgi:hypothetical protein
LFGEDKMTDAAHGPALGFGAELTGALQALLPEVAEHTVAAVIHEVPGYGGAWSGSLGADINRAVEMALAGFLSLASRSEGSDPSTPLGPTLEGAYALGRGEARSGRSMDALLAAYRVGARVAWRELAGAAVERGLPAEALTRFAELVFAYIDQLSAASAAGHADELAMSGRVRQRRLERLGQSLLGDAPPETLVAAAERAEWSPPGTLTALLLPEGRLRGVLVLLDERSLQVPTEGDEAVVLAADLSGPARAQVLAQLEGKRAVVGLARPWLQAASSYRLARRARDLGAALVDVEAHLPELVLGADPDALADLRRRALAPLEDLRPASRDKLEETLRSWLLHHGRREAVAADLFVHPQTVRYRMGQLRELYGERLEDPGVVLELTLALGARSVGRST